MIVGNDKVEKRWVLQNGSGLNFKDSDFKHQYTNFINKTEHIDKAVSQIDYILGSIAPQFAYGYSKDAVKAVKQKLNEFDNAMRTLIRTVMKRQNDYKFEEVDVDDKDLLSIYRN